MQRGTKFSAIQMWKSNIQRALAHSLRQELADTSEELEETTAWLQETKAELSLSSARCADHAGALGASRAAFVTVSEESSQTAFLMTRQLTVTQEALRTQQIRTSALRARAVRAMCCKAGRHADKDILRNTWQAWALRGWRRAVFRRALISSRLRTMRGVLRRWTSALLVFQKEAAQAEQTQYGVDVSELWEQVSAMRAAANDR